MSNKLVIKKIRSKAYSLKLPYLKLGTAQVYLLGGRRPFNTVERTQAVDSGLNLKSRYKYYLLDLWPIATQTNANHSPFINKILIITINTNVLFRTLNFDKVSTRSRHAIKSFIIVLILRGHSGSITWLP